MESHEKDKKSSQISYIELMSIITSINYKHITLILS